MTDSPAPARQPQTDDIMDAHRLGGLIERAIRDHQRKLRNEGRTSGLMPDGWTIADMVLGYPPETPTEPSQPIPAVSR